MKYGISLYSLQEDYFTCKYDLEGCIAVAANVIGAKGIEYIPEQTPLKSYPEYSDADVDYWFGLMDKYKVEPTSMSQFVDYTLYPNRVWTLGERIECVMGNLKRAGKLGFKVMRNSLLNRDDVKVFEACLPLAEELGLQLAIEIHMPRSIHSWYTQDFLELIGRTGTKNGGFVPDFGIFATGLQLPRIERFLMDGGKEKFVDIFNSAYRSKEMLSDEDIVKMGGGAPEIALWGTLKVQIYDDPEWLKEVLPYTIHCHGKFYGINEQGYDPSIDYKNALRVLKENHYQGYISCEYEGFRDYFTGEYGAYPDPVAECVRHHEMVDRYWNAF